MKGISAAVHRTGWGRMRRFPFKKRERFSFFVNALDIACLGMVKYPWGGVSYSNRKRPRKDLSVSIPLGWVDQSSGEGRSALFPRTSRIKTLLLPKFLRVFRELFIKSFLNGVWGNATNSLFDTSKPEGLHHKNIGAKLRKGGLFNEKVHKPIHSYLRTRFMFTFAVALLLPVGCSIDSVHRKRNVFAGA